MSSDRDTTRIVRSWLRTDEHESADRVLEAVLERLDATPQRRATWWPAGRLPQMNNTAKLALGAAAVVAVAFLGLRFLVPSEGIGGPSSTSTPTATPNEMHLRHLYRAAGTYYVDTPFPAHITFDVPGEWEYWQNAPDVQGLLAMVPPNDSGWGIAFSLVDDVYIDPCDRDLGVTDLPSGVSVDDLMEALSVLPGVEAGPPVDIAIDGFDGKLIELTATYDRADCPTVNAGLWTSPGGGSIGLSVGAVHRVNQVRLLDVGGTPVAIWTSDFPETTEFEEDQGMAMDPEQHADDQVEMRQILDSIRIRPD